MTEERRKFLELDFLVDLYTDKLFRRAGGVILSNIHDKVTVSDGVLYKRCIHRAVTKYVCKGFNTVLK
jgi:hypothetical protein